MSDFLARHGGDPNQQIIPDQLMPLNSNANLSTTPRRRSSSTHTLVIPTQQHFKVHSSTSQYSISHAQHQNGTINSSNHNAISQTPSTPARYINSTPPSRRSSMCNSPEPLSASSGYNSMVNGASAGRLSQMSSISTNTNNQSGLTNSTKIPVLRRRRLSSINDSTGLAVGNSGSRFGFSGLSRSTSSSILSPDLNGSHSMIPRSATGSNLKLSRYPNYLTSSQHITGRMVSAASSSSTDFPDGSSSIPMVTPVKASTMQLRKPVQRNF